MKKAQIENGVIINLIEIDPENIPEWAETWPTIVREGVDIGWIWTGDEATAYLPAPNLEKLATSVRTERNNLLAASDWTQVEDAPVDKLAWATYRQALRDITAQAGFPETIEWPSLPA